ncbi:deoxyribodipyrimidine photo-lyase-like [Planococcus citri]|uniref:deoxyribodipyrimidine photo-lyase-like n=1 Tax=Planococcus citri TaxID=170843 RepID=UPI0031F85570
MPITVLRKLDVKLFISQPFLRTISSQVIKMSSKRKTAGTSNQSIKKFLKTDSSEESKSEVPDTSSSKELKSFDAFMEKIESDRAKAASSIMEFKFNKKRARVLSSATDFPDWGTGVIYWMFRDQRIQDNWALLYAQKLAIKNEVPLHVCFCRLPKFLDATIRHFDFIFKGLQESEIECKKLDIQFHFLIGCGADILPEFVEKNKLGAVVIDFCPLRLPQTWAEQLTKTLPKDVPLIQIDAHNVVPCWHASDKKEYAARTIRSKINNKLGEFLTDYPPVVKHPFKSSFKAESIDWSKAGESLEVDRSVGPVTTFTPGYNAGMKNLYEFVSSRVKIYDDARNDPTKGALSNISPWLHFGQISPQRCALSAKKFASKYKKSAEAFCEELVVRRELSENFCYYNKNYDSIEGAENWARTTLNDHRKDKREKVYTKEQLEQSKTHDLLWNAAQKQMVVEGKMHGFLRMYWAKKILEWTKSPEEALEISIYLNDKYSMDGRDPNGYVGCMWSICGTHDQGWRERAVFGKIRYMNYDGCKRKFDVLEFIRRYKNK